MSRGRHAAPSQVGPNARKGAVGFAILATMVGQTPSALADHPQEPPEEPRESPRTPLPNQEESAPAVAAVPPPPLTIHYVVVPGDTLSQIAVDSLALPAWEQFYAQNVEVVGPNPHLILPGQELSYDATATEPIPQIPAFEPAPAEVEQELSVEQVEQLPEAQAQVSESIEASFGLAPIGNSFGPVQVKTQEAADAVFANVRGASLIKIGGTRASARDPHGHPSGRALDYMVLGDAALGDAIAQYHIDNWDSLGVQYLIWQQRIRYSAAGEWEWMADRGDATQNHYDHVHVNY